MSTVPCSAEAQEKSDRNYLAASVTRGHFLEKAEVEHRRDFARKGGYNRNQNLLLKQRLYLRGDNSRLRRCGLSDKRSTSMASGVILVSIGNDAGVGEYTCDAVADGVMSCGND